MEQYKTKTRIDARVRCLDFRTGMLADEPTMEYLLEMQRQLNLMLSSVMEEIYMTERYERNEAEKRQL